MGADEVKVSFTHNLKGQEWVNFLKDVLGAICFSTVVKSSISILIHKVEIETV